jgi:Tfp pilus assembly PilM family ATPase
MIGRRTLSPIGIELTAESVRVLQLRRTAAGWATQDQLHMPRLDTQTTWSSAEVTRLAAALDRRRFRGRFVVLALPHRDTCRGLLEVTPEPHGDPLLAAARDLERSHGLEPGSYELAAWLPPATARRRQTAVCVSGCRHAVTHELLRQFDRVGLTCRAIDTRAFALSRVVDLEGQAGPHLTAVLDLDLDAAELILLHRGGVVYQRALMDAGLQNALRPLADRGLERDAAWRALTRFGLGQVESEAGRVLRGTLLAAVQQLVREVRPALDYAGRMLADLPLRRFTLVGPGASVPLLDYELRQQLQLEPASSRPTPVLSDEADPAAAVTLGLTLHPEEAAWAAA